MQRRDFVSLAALAAARPAPAEAQEGRWRFLLDPRGRWSVTRGGVTPIRDAEISVRMAGEPAAFPLSALDNVRRIRTGSRRSGEFTWTLVGRRGGVEFSALFDDDDDPKVSVRARGLESPRDLVSVHFTGGVTLPHRHAWINAYDSSGTCRVLELSPGATATGFWQLVLLGAARGSPDFGLAFGEDDGGSGEFRINGRSLDAAAVFRHRAVSVDQPPAVASLAIIAGGEPFAALGRDAAHRVGRPLARTTLSGWSARGNNVSETEVLANLEWAQRHLDARAFRVMRLGDGYQRAAGDWETNELFPHGHRWLTDRIHAAGFDAGLWLAPFAVSAASGIPAVHPEWILHGVDNRPLLLEAPARWGGAVHVLDASQRAVQDWLRQLARHAVQQWGYDFLELDDLASGAMGGRQERAASGHEALRAGLRALREGAGRAFVLGSGAPLQYSLGAVDGLRIGDTVDAEWGGVAGGIQAALLRAHLNLTAWGNDPGPVVVREPLALDEARAWAATVALSGQMAFTEARLERLSEARVELLQRVMPPASVRARALDLATGRPAQLLARSREDWWTLALLNPGADAARITADLGAAGVAGPLAVFDVWAERRLADADGRIAVSVPSHGCAVLGLRRARRMPFILGSTRHLVQGTFDLWDERWDPRARRLSGRSVLMDGRTYALTIALPSGFTPKSCTANVACRLEAVVSRAVRVEFAGSKEDIEWAVDF